MDYSTSENESLSEIETLKQQLTTYRMINTDLSKKIQELKTELNLYRQNNAEIHKELLEEKTKNAECRRNFIMISKQCNDFINTYVNTMQQISASDMTLINEIPGISPAVDEQITPNAQESELRRPQRQSIRDQLRSLQGSEEDEGNNILHTIVEESSLPFTSTPFVTRASHRRMSSPETSHDLSDITPSNQIKNVSETPKFPTVHAATRRLSALVDQKCMSSKAIESTQDDETTKMDENESSQEELTTCRTVKEVETMQECSIALNPKEIEESTVECTKLIKECRVPLTPLVSTCSDKENDSDPEESTAEPSAEEKKIPREPRVAALKALGSSNILTRSGSSSYEDEESVEEESSKTKNRSKTRVMLRRKCSGSGLPKRKARPDPEMWTEKSLKTKLRRSSDKKKYM